MSGRLLISILVLGLGVSSVFPQSLADAAKKERERQQKVKADAKTPPKVLTERDLKSTGGKVTQNRNASADAKGADMETKAAGSNKDLNGHDEAYWRQCKAAIQEELIRIEQRMQEIDTFLGRDHTTYTLSSLAPIKTERDRLAKQAEETRQKFSALEEEARKAGAPAGWLR